MEYVPSTKDSLDYYPMQCNLVRNLAIKSRLDMAKPWLLAHASSTSRLSVSTRHESEKLANRYAKELRLRNDLLYKINNSYSAARIW